jgi:predicted transcriptional regulator
MDEANSTSPYKQRGRPPKTEVKGRLLEILEQRQLGTTHLLKKLYRENFGKELSWNTVKKYLTKLVQEGKVEKQVTISHSNGDQVVVYKIGSDREAE